MYTVYKYDQPYVYIWIRPTLRTSMLVVREQWFELQHPYLFIVYRKTAMVFVLR